MEQTEPTTNTQQQPQQPGGCSKWNTIVEDGVTYRVYSVKRVAYVSDKEDRTSYTGVIRVKYATSVIALPSTKWKYAMKHNATTTPLKAAKE